MISDATRWRPSCSRHWRATWIRDRPRRRRGRPGRAGPGFVMLLHLPPITVHSRSGSAGREDDSLPDQLRRSLTSDQARVNQSRSLRRLGWRSSRGTLALATARTEHPRGCSVSTCPGRDLATRAGHARRHRRRLDARPAEARLPHPSEVLDSSVQSDVGSRSLTSVQPSDSVQWASTASATSVGSCTRLRDPGLLRGPSRGRSTTHEVVRCLLAPRPPCSDAAAADPRPDRERPI